MQWVEQDKDDIVASLVDGIVSRMSEDEMRTLVWNTMFDDLIMDDYISLYQWAEEVDPKQIPALNAIAEEVGLSVIVRD